MITISLTPSHRTALKNVIEYMDLNEQEDCANYEQNCEDSGIPAGHHIYHDVVSLKELLDQIPERIEKPNYVCEACDIRWLDKIEVRKVEPVRCPNCDSLKVHPI